MISTTAPKLIHTPKHYGGDIKQVQHSPCSQRIVLMDVRIESCVITGDIAQVRARGIIRGRRGRRVVHLIRAASLFIIVHPRLTTQIQILEHILRHSEVVFVFFLPDDVKIRAVNITPLPG
jgi:hypothetical protein